MVNCEMCGSDVNSVVNIRVAGSIVRACSSCKSMGKEVDGPSVGQSSHTFYKKSRNNLGEESVVENYASILSSAISRKGLNTHQAARLTNIKESTLNKFLTSKLKPDVDIAKRLERFFEITLLERVSGGSVDSFINDDKSSNLTLGDMIRDQLNK